MSTSGLKLPQSGCQSEEEASGTCVASVQQSFLSSDDVSRFQDVKQSEEEKLTPIPPDQRCQREDEETRTTASPSLFQFDEWKSCRDLQIILLRSKKASRGTSEHHRHSSISVKLPSGGSKNCNADAITLQTANLDKAYTAYQHHTEREDAFSTKVQCCGSTGKWFKVGTYETAISDEDILHQHAHKAAKDGQNPGMQTKTDIQILTRLDLKNSTRQPTQLFQRTPTRVKKELKDCRENDSTTPQTHKYQTSGLKANTYSKPRGQYKIWSMVNLPASHSESLNEPEPNVVIPTSTMFTSALTTVLAPAPWSARLRRPKQSGNGVENEDSDHGPNVRPTVSPFQNQQQQSFFPLQRQTSDQRFSNNGEIQLSGETTYSPDWQKENNSPNIKATLQTRKPIDKSSSVGSPNNKELQTFSTSEDNRQVGGLSYSRYRVSKSGDEPFKSFSSKPTTSSLLLSLRRSNLRNSRADPKQPQTARSIRSLTLPSRHALKTPSFGHSVSTNVEMNIDKGEIHDTDFHFARRIKTRPPLHIPLFRDKSEVSKIQEFSDVREGNHHKAPITTTSSKLESLSGEQSAYLSLLKNYSSKMEKNHVGERTGKDGKYQNDNITKQQMTPGSVYHDDSTNCHSMQLFNNTLNSQGTHSNNYSGTSTFADRLNFSPRKDSVANDVSQTIIEDTCVSSKNNSQLSPKTMDLSSPLSPGRPLRGIRVPSIYAYLRESSSPVSTSISNPTVHVESLVPSPLKQGGGTIQDCAQKTSPSRFTFDFNTSPPQDQALPKSTYGSSTCLTPTQSLPPDLGGALARLSHSPYSSLISSRHTLTNTFQGVSSPPESTNIRSASDDISIANAGLGPSSTTHTNKVRRSIEKSDLFDGENRTAVQAYTSILNYHRPAQPCLSETAPSLILESQSANTSPHPKEYNVDSNTFTHQEHDCLLALQHVDVNAYQRQGQREKENCLIFNQLREQSETSLGVKKETSGLLKNGSLLEIQRCGSKDELLASEVKTDNVFPSTAIPDKGIKYFKTKRNSPVFKTNSRIDQMLNRLKTSFGVKPTESTLDTDTTLLPQFSLTGTSLKQEKEEKRSLINQQEQSMFIYNLNEHSKMENSSPSLITDKTYLGQSLVIIKKPKNMFDLNGQNRTSERSCSEAMLDTPITSLNSDKVQSSLPSGSSVVSKQGVVQEKMFSDENGNQSYKRHKAKAQNMNCFATLPRYKKSHGHSTSPNYLHSSDSEDQQNDSVFYSPVFKKTTSLCESEDFSPMSSPKVSLQQNLVRSRLSSSCADLKFGLPSGRSFSVTGMISSRPSGPGRISTSSVSDVSSLDGSSPKGIHTETGNPSQLDFADPTPPPSPTLSLSPRRISQGPAMSSPIRLTPGSLSPLHGVLPSMSYTASFFDESGSDTTTDDEYILGSDDEELETEL